MYVAVIQAMKAIVYKYLPLQDVTSCTSNYDEEFVNALFHFSFKTMQF